MVLCCHSIACKAFLSLLSLEIVSLQELNRRGVKPRQLELKFGKEVVI